MDENGWPKFVKDWSAYRGKRDLAYSYMFGILMNISACWWTRDVCWHRDSKSVKFCLFTKGSVPSAYAFPMSITALLAGVLAAIAGYKKIFKHGEFCAWQRLTCSRRETEQQMLPFTLDVYTRSKCCPGQYFPACNLCFLLRWNLKEWTRVFLKVPGHL